MNITEILIATGMIAAVGLIIGLFLGVASMKFEVEKNEMEEKILGILPGYNCGACGYAGCASCATAITSKEAKVNACTVGGKQVGEQIARLLGVDAVFIAASTALPVIMT
ncbi:MAG: RnfABCDGE type electron transport complex subunit B, partial [Clostridiales bacterium]|nr:RnfABCDGE type electron transport complex subunit B [Clostridiales bacterium]